MAMSQRVLAMDGLPAMEPGSSSEFCKHPGCYEFAQSADPTIEDTLKYYCPKHEAAARVRGESGKRDPLADAHDWVGSGQRGITINNHKPRTEKQVMPEMKPVAAYNDAGELVGTYDSASAAAGGKPLLAAAISYACKHGSRARANGLRYRQLPSADAAPKSIDPHPSRTKSSAKPKPAQTQSAPAAPVAAGPAARPSESCGREPAGPWEVPLSLRNAIASSQSDAVGQILNALGSIAAGGKANGSLRITYLEVTM
jgi:hypothetical protein